MNKLKVVFLVGGFPTISETFIVSNIIYAIRNGFDVKIFCKRFLGLENSSQKEELNHYRVKELISPPIKPSNSRIGKLIQLFSFLIHPRNLYYVWKYRSYSAKLFSNCAFILKQYTDVSSKHVFHVHFNNSLEYLKDIATIGYVKPRVIVTFHGNDAFMETQETFQAKYGAFYEKHVKAVTVNSNYLKEAVMELGVREQLINVVPIGIDKDSFNGIPKTIRSNQIIKILTVGRLVQLKGHLYGLKTIKRLKERGHNVHYTIVGDGVEKSNLENEIKILGIEDNITFTGATSQEEVKRFMRNSHIFLMTSTFDNITGRREAFGLVSIEAQAMGLPVIGFRSGGFSDTIIEDETGFTVKDRSDSEMTEKVVQLVENPDLYNGMSIAAINHAARFDHRFTTQLYLDMYNKILKRD